MLKYTKYNNVNVDGSIFCEYAVVLPLGNGIFPFLNKTAYSPQDQSKCPYYFHISYMQP